MPGTGVSVERDVGRPTREPRDLRELAIGERGVVPHRLHQGGPAGDHRRLLGLDDVERGSGFEPLDAQHGHAGLDRGAQDQRATDPEEREDAQDLRVFVVGAAGRAEPVGTAQHGALRVHNALRVRTRPRGVRDLREIRRHDLSLNGRDQFVVDPGIDIRLGFQLDRRRPRTIRAARDPDCAERRGVGEKEWRTRRRRKARNALLQHQLHVTTEDGPSRDERVDVADPQDLADLGRTVRGREGHDERADPARGEPRDQPLVPVREGEADAGALAHARADHALGQPARTLLGLGIGHPAIRRDDEVAVAPLLRRAVQRDRDGGQVPEVGNFDRHCQLPRPARWSSVRLRSSSFPVGIATKSVAPMSDRRRSCAATDCSSPTTDTSAGPAAPSRSSTAR